MLRTIAAGEEFDHPTLDAPGWWHRLDRLCYPPVTHREQGISSSRRTINKSGNPSRTLLITGATGTLGRAFARICEIRGLPYNLLSRAELDIANRNSVVAALGLYEPWAIINAAGYVRVDAAEAEPETCLRENVTGPECLARECAVRKVPLVTFSSDLVFDGLKKAPYVESDPTAPINVYGKSKAEAEVRVLRQFSEALIIRTGAFFGPWDRFNFVRAVLDNLSNGKPFFAADDVTISPTYIPDLVNAALDLVIDNEQGIWHIANSAAVTWAEFARLVAWRGGYDSMLVESRSSRSVGFIARRPSFTPLLSERANFLPSFEQSLEKFFEDTKWHQPRCVVSVRHNF